MLGRGSEEGPCESMSCGARVAHSVRVFPTLWVFLLRVAVLRDSGK